MINTVLKDATREPTWIAAPTAQAHRGSRVHAHLALGCICINLTVSYNSHTFPRGARSASRARKQRHPATAHWRSHDKLGECVYAVCVRCGMSAGTRRDCLPSAFDIQVAGLCVNPPGVRFGRGHLHGSTHCYAVGPERGHSIQSPR